MISGRHYLLLSMLAAMAAACSNDMEKVKFFDRQNLPTQTLVDATVLRSEQGKVQVRLQAPYIAQYQTPQPKTIYPQGVTVCFFDDNNDSTATLTAHYAVSWDDANIMTARDSVVVIDFSTHDTIYLQDIVWNSNEHRVYSNKPLHAKNGDRVTWGDSFHSDDTFEHLQIVNQRGTVVIEDNATSVEQ